MKTFAISFDPDQARPMVRPDLDTKYLTGVFLKDFCKKCRWQKCFTFRFANGFIYERLAQDISLPTSVSGGFCRLLITFASSFDPDQDP